jgi:hypothetical protein
LCDADFLTILLSSANVDSQAVTLGTNLIVFRPGVLGDSREMGKDKPPPKNLKRTNGKISLSSQNNKELHTGPNQRKQINLRLSGGQTTRQ